MLIATLFDGCLRVSQALGLRPVDLVQSDMGWAARVMGKGRKTGMVALSAPLVGQLHAYATGWGCPGTAAYSPLAGAGSIRSFRKPPSPPGLPYRSSGRGPRPKTLRGNRPAGGSRKPQGTSRLAKALKRPETLRYMETLSAKRSLEINQGVDLGISTATDSG